MCARFTQELARQAVRDLYRIVREDDPPPLLPRYNGAPTRDFAVCRVRAGRAAGNPRREIARLRWGIGRGFSGRGSPHINARAETVHRRNAFAEAFRRRRCLVPANGWFEWIRAGRRRLPYFLAAADGGLLSFAGIWQTAENAGPETAAPPESFAILTTAALPALRRIHDRQPAIVPPAAFDDWLDPSTPEARLLELAREPPPGPYEIRPVSVRANSVANDDPDILKPRPELFAPPSG